MATAGEGTLRHLGAGLWDALRQRCPRCRKGRMFRGGFTMNDPCPVCGLVFQREEGYFLGAMYVSYVLSTALLVVFYGVATLLLPDWDSLYVALIALVPYVPFVPAVFRYSRVLWIYLDRSLCPGDESAGAYEKVRQQAPARPQDTPLGR